MVHGQGEDVKLDTQTDVAKAHAEQWLEEAGKPDEEGDAVGGQG
jgi:hypothetical protein